jgi:hypothetical protein
MKKKYPFLHIIQPLSDNWKIAPTGHFYWKISILEYMPMLEQFSGSLRPRRAPG